MIDIPRTMLVTGLFLCLLLQVKQIDGRSFQRRVSFEDRENSSSPTSADR